MKIAKITLTYLPTVFAGEDCRRLRLTVETPDRQYNVDRIVKNSDVVAFYDLVMKSITAEMRTVLIGNETLH